MTLKPTSPLRPAFDAPSTKQSSTETTITCPKCKTQIPLTEALTGPLLAAKQQEYEQQIAEYAQRSQDDVAAKQQEFEQALAENDRNFVRAVAEAENIAKARAKKEVQEATAEELRAAGEVNAKLSDRLSVLEHADKELRSALTAAQQAQVAAIKRERELDSKERELELTIEQRVTEAASTMRAQAKSEVADEYKLQLMQSDQAARELREQIEDLKRKALESSTRMQGEVQEVDLEVGLRARFPFDTIDEVAKGVRGADAVQTVVAPSGAQCGVILYESKRTRNWASSWLPKLRDDGRTAKADILVLVTQAMPEGVEGFDQVDNVWVTSPQHVLPLAQALRAALLGAHAVRQAQAGMQSKSEEVYAYVTGPQFKHRVEALVEAFSAMREDLEAEKRAVTRQWAKREAQVERVMTSTAGMFGDMQGIAGRALPEPSGLTLTD